MNKAVFLDRDGVLCQEKGRYLNSVEEFELLSHVPQLLKRLKDAGYLLIMISNQGVISRGLLTQTQVDEMHAKMQLELEEFGVRFDALYYCPHHPEIEACICRKPEPLMIEKGLARFNIDPQNAFMIGDSPRDVEAAQRAGITGFQISPNANWGYLLDTILKE